MEDNVLLLDRMLHLLKCGCVLHFRALRPCRRTARNPVRTGVDTGGPHCIERQEAASSGAASPSAGRRRGTSPSRGCVEVEEAKEEKTSAQ